MSLIKVKSRGTDNVSGRRNLLINGAMQVAQRGTSSTGVGAADNYFTLDRWYCNTNGNSAGRLTMTQTAITDLPEFQNCLKFACTTADTSIAAAERFMLEYKMEGQDAQGLAKGTSSAKPVTVSFYVKGHDSATYTVGLYEGTTGRKIAATFPVTTSWVRQTVTFPGDTTGVIPNNNTAQLNLRFYLHGGTNYTSGTFGTSWNGGGNTVQISSSGNSIFESTSATFFLTGVQLEVGDSASDFEHRSFGEELDLCERYFQTYSDRMWQGTNEHAANYNMYLDGVFTKRMRAAPTATIVGEVNIARPQVGVSQRPNVIDLTSPTGFRRCGWPTSGTYGGQLGSHGDAYYRMQLGSGPANQIQFSAEL